MRTSVDRAFSPRAFWRTTRSPTSNGVISRNACPVTDAGHQRDRDGADTSTPPCSPPGTGQSDQVLCSQEPGKHYRGYTMEDSAGHAERSADVRDEIPHWFSCMDAGDRSGLCVLPPAREPPALRDLLRGAFLGAQLQNDSCWCWANAGLLCTIWALLCRQTFSLEVQIRPVRAFLHRLQTTPGTSVALAFPDSPSTGCIVMYATRCW